MTYPPRFSPPSSDRFAMIVVMALMVVLIFYGVTPAVMPRQEP